MVSVASVPPVDGFPTVVAVLVAVDSPSVAGVTAVAVVPFVAAIIAGAGAPSVTVVPAVAGDPTVAGWKKERKGCDAGRAG